MSKKVVLVILDGWGIGDGSSADATFAANVPFFNDLRLNSPTAKLKTSGEDVGLPDGQMGNSEVGHLNIGAGRIVYQDLVRINLACKNGDLESNQVLASGFEYAKKERKAVHFLGLVSDGGVHSSLDHLFALCSLAKTKGLEKVFVHAITDGRDTDPTSGYGYLSKLESYLNQTTGKIATVIGRYYAMDRDKRWERVKLAYDALINGKGRPITSCLKGVKLSYSEGCTDEFIKPMVVINDDFEPIGKIMPGDVVVCFNFRTDRCREITQVLTQKDMPEFEMSTLPLNYITMTNYDSTFKGVKVMFDKDNLSNTLGEVLAENGKTQLRIAETEKYPHVTFFFSGGREAEFSGERRILVQSPKVATYDLMPEMSAYQVKDEIVKVLKNSEVDFVCLNFANPDMVGHTGDFKAVVKALETVDLCLKEVVEIGKASGYSFLIIADHGNSEYMINKDGSPNTAHTTNQVPVILVDREIKHIHDGRLADIAPTILKLMEINAPSEMTGKALI